MIKKTVLAFFLIAALCLPFAFAEEADVYTYTNVTNAAELQEWIAKIPRNQKVGMRLTADITAAAFSLPDTYQNDYDIAIDLNGKTLTLTEPFVGPSGTDAMYFGYSTEVLIKNGTLKTNADIAALIRNKAQDLTLRDVTVGDGNRTYSDGVICTPKGDLHLTGSTSLLQGPNSTLALSIGEENTERCADVVINTTGVVNGRIRVLPISKNQIGSTLTVENILSTAKASEPGNPGAITASSNFNLVSEAINVKGGTWSAFLFDSYCADGLVSVRVGDGDYRIYKEEEAPVAAVNNAGRFLFRYASLEDCLNTAITPSNRPEITLWKDTELTAPIRLTRKKNLLLDLNGCSLTNSSGNVLINGMNKNILTIVDRKSGGQLGTLGLEPDTETVIGYIPFEDPRANPNEFFDQFTIDQLSLSASSPQARVYAPEKFARANQVQEWKWEKADTSEIWVLKQLMVAMRPDLSEIDQFFTSFEEAYAKHIPRCTLRLLRDQTLSNTVLTFDNTIVLDLGGHTLTLDSVRIISHVKKGNGIGIKNGRIQVVSGSSTIDAAGGNILLEGDIDDGLTIEGDQPLLSVRSGGTIWIHNATVHSTGNTRAAMVASKQSISYLDITDGGSLICDNGIAAELIDAGQIRLYDGKVKTGSETKPAIYYRATSDYGGTSCNVLIKGTEAPGVMHDSEIHGSVQMIGGQTDITGGLFSDTSVRQYLSENYALNESMQSVMYRVVPKENDVKYKVIFAGNNIGTKNNLGEDQYEYYQVVELGYNEAVKEPETIPEWQGHVFCGWYRFSAGKLEEEPFDFTTIIKENTYLQARWSEDPTCTITFIMQDTREVLGSQTINKGSSLDQSLIPVPQKDGYRFIGWYEIFNSYSIPFLVDSIQNENHTVTACFEKISENNPDYTVAFDSDGGTQVENQGVNSGETAYEPIEPIKDGALFEDWHLVTEGILASEAYSFATPVNKSIGLKANWSYSVTFDSNGGNPVEMQWVTSGGKVEEPSEGPYRNSYEFGGWYRKNADGELEENPFNFDTEITESITLVAKWIPVFYVGFDKGDGDTMMTVPVLSGNSVASDRIPDDPMLEGFRFDGWHLKMDDGIAEDPFDLSTEIITQDTILVAKWVPEYTVTFVSDGGTPSPVAAIVEQGESVEKPADPVKDNYDFAGWHQMTMTDNGNAVIADGEFDFSTQITESITLLSKWMEYLAPTSVTYYVRSWDGSKIIVTEKTEDLIPLPEGSTIPAGKYFLNRNVTVNGRLSLEGNTELILGDGRTLDVKGLYVPKGSTLTIYGQIDGTGKIYSRPSAGAGIGAYADHKGGSIVIHGGMIDAKGHDHCAGIGGNDNDQKDIGSIIVYGGTVIANGGESGAGIGGGRACEGGNISIYGGKVTATGGHYGAGIGGGNGQGTNPMRGAHAGTINIWGGTIIAKGGDDGAGIGGGEGGNAGSITIHGGIVTATGGNNGAGIGCGEAEDTGIGGTVTINGGTVTAYGGDDGAAIGGGDDGYCTVIINGGTVTANNDDSTNAAGIGGGNNADGGTITINGGTVYAISRDGAGIGGGEDGDGGTITINGGEVHADPAGEGNGAAIGGGNHSGAGGTINITGGTVYANGKHGAGIGGGRAQDSEAGTSHYGENNSGAGGKITITGGTVNATSTNGFGIGAGGQQGDMEWYDDGYSNLTGSAGTITIGGTAKVTAEGRPGGIGGDSGTITFNGNCDVKTSGSTKEDYGAGIMLMSGDRHFEINGGSVTSTAIGNADATRLGTALIITGGSFVTQASKDNLRCTGFDIHGDFRFKTGSSEDAATVVNYRERMGINKLSTKYISIAPCDHVGTTNAVGLCTACEHQEYPVKYIEYSWADGKLGRESKDSPSDTVAFPYKDNTSIPGGWYILNDNISVNGRVSLEGDTHLILGDGCTLDVKGLYIPKGSTLTVYGQSDGENAGKINSHPSGGAGIGAYSGHKGGNIIIHGGTIIATGHEHCAGIGSNDGDGSDVGSFTMYGGTVTATGGSEGAGIGGGQDSDGGVITIYGGTVTATGKDSSAGIGGSDASGSRADSSTIDIYGGIITATGNSKGAGIGGGEYGHATITISGGNVTATGGSSGGAGIGSGVDGSASTITITGGAINATGVSGGAGIGDGKNSSGSTITLSYSDATKDTISITASSCKGTATLTQAFMNTGNPLLIGVISDNDVLSAGTLTAWDGQGLTWSGLQEIIRYSEKEQVIGLNNDITAGETDTCLNVPAGKQIRLELNGHTIDRGLGERTEGISGGSVFHVENGAELSIRGSGIICGGFSNDYGGGIYNAGTLLIDNATITGNKAQYIGGGIYNSGALTLSDVTVSSNEAVNSMAGGIFVWPGTLNVKGNTSVTGNKAYSKSANILLADSEVLNVIGELDEGARLGVTLWDNQAVPGIITSGLSGMGTAENFVSDYDSYLVGLNEAGEALLGAPVTVTFDPGIEGASGTMEGVTIAAGSVYQLPDCDYTFEGMVFSKWQVTIGDGEPQEKNTGERFTVTDDTTVTAKWIIPHSIIIGKTEKGIVTTDKSIAGTGETVTLTVTPSDGCELSSLSVTCGGDEVPVEENYTFIMPDGDVTVQAIFAHIHKYTFTADGAIITAVCDYPETCDLPDGGAALTVIAPAMTVYGDGKSAETTIEGSIPAVTIPAVVYWKGGEELDGAPVNAGTYTASITLGEGDSTATASVTYSIAKAVPDYTAPTGVTAVYGQTLADVSLAEYSGWSWDCENPSDVSLTETGFRFFPAVFTPEDGDNYENVSGISILVKVDQAPNPAFVTPMAYLTRSSSPDRVNSIDLSPDVTDNYIRRNGATGAIHYAISGDANGCVLDGSVFTSGNQEGVVTVTVTIEKDSHYQALEMQNITISITDKTTASLAKVTQDSCAYAEELPPYSYTNPQHEGTEQILYSGTLWNGTDYGPTVEKPTEAGSYTMTVIYETADVIYSGSTAFAISPVSLAEASVTLDRTELVYSGSEQNVSVTEVKIGEKTLLMSDYTVSGTSGTDSGEYTVTVSGIGNCKDDANAVFSILPQPLEATVSMDGYTWGGAVPEPSVSSNPGGAVVEYYFNTEDKNSDGVRWNTEIGSGLGVGTYYMYAVIPASGNYTGTTTKTAEFTVSSPVFGPVTFFLPAGVREIGDYAFEGSDMTVVYIPDTCESIGAYAFRECGNLRQIRIPGDCTIDPTAFEGCGTVLVFSSTESKVQSYCNEDEHMNCVFVEENE